MNGFVFIVLTIVFVQIDLTFQNDPVLPPKCSELAFCARNSTCLRKAQEPLSLKCFNVQSWYRAPDNTSLGKYGEVKLPEEYQIDHCLFDTKARELPQIQEYLTIKSLSNKDTGYGAYYAYVDFWNYICTYNIFVYDDANSINVSFAEFNTIDDKTTVEYISLDTTFDYTFQIEALPMNDLTLDGKKVPQINCQNESTMPWLNCLESVGSQLKPEKCLNSKSLKLSYTYENEQEYRQKAKEFTHTVEFEYAPQMKDREKNLTLTGYTTTLICEVECSNPEVDNFQWYYANSTLIQTTGKVKQLAFKLDSDESVRVYCVASNKVSGPADPTDLDKQPHTQFFISVKPTSKTSGGLEEWEIVLIVVSIFVIVLIVVGVTLVSLLFKKRKGKGVEESSTGISLEPGVSDRKAQLNNELLDNPIYGSSNSVLTSHSL